MKAMILSAGKGTRLGALTNSLPKPLLPAAGRPLIGYILANLRAHGVREVVINLHFEGEQIRTALGDGLAHGLRIHYSEEPELLGTAGGVKHAAVHFQNEDVFLVHYGDIVTDEDLSDMARKHRENKALVTLLVHHRRKSNSAIVFDEQFVIREFHERPDESFWDSRDSAWVNSGVMLMSPEVLNHVPENAHVDWPKDIFPQLLATGRMFAHPLSAYRIAVDSPERLRQLEADLVAGTFKGTALSFAQPTQIC
jgi:mannose-1-phosphate guanylyltransferase/phosphomannomutase